jgi:hypothetical protein
MRRKIDFPSHRTVAHIRSCIHRLLFIQLRMQSQSIYYTSCKRREEEGERWREEERKTTKPLTRHFLC